MTLVLLILKIRLSSFRTTTLSVQVETCHYQNPRPNIAVEYLCTGELAVIMIYHQNQNLVQA